MTLPDDFDDPREDLRPPEYYSGFRRDTVPATRLRVYSLIGANDFFGFLNDGVVIQSVREVDDPLAKRNCDAQWEGYFDYRGDTWRLLWQCNMINFPENGVGNVFARIEGQPETWFWRDTIQVIRNPRNALSAFRFGEYPEEPPIVINCWHIPEWSKPSEYYPGVIIGRKQA